MWCKCSTHYLPQLKFTDAPASSVVPAAPVLWIVNDIKLIDPLPDGKFGAAPDGNLNAVLNPTVATPTFSILIVWLSASVPPVTSIVTSPVANTLWSSALDNNIWVVIPDGVIDSVVRPTAKLVNPDPYKLINIINESF